MRTDDTTYIVVRFQEGGITCAGTHLIRECAELQAERLNERRKRCYEAKRRVQESVYYDDYMDYDGYMEMKKADLAKLAEEYGFAQSGTKHDIAVRIMRAYE